MKYLKLAFVGVPLTYCLSLLAPLDCACQTSQLGIESAKVWTSVTTGKDYKIRADGGHLYIEGILPAALQEQGASFRCDLVRQETVWLGTCIANLLFRLPDTSNENQVKLCRIETKEKINLLSETRIEGEFETLDTRESDAATCTVKKGPMKHFAWIPKK